MDYEYLFEGIEEVAPVQETESATAAPNQQPELLMRAEVTQFDPTNLGHLAMIGVIAGTSAAITWLNLRETNNR